MSGNLAAARKQRAEVGTGNGHVSEGVDSVGVEALEAIVATHSGGPSMTTVGHLEAGQEPHSYGGSPEIAAAKINGILRLTRDRNVSPPVDRDPPHTSQTVALGFQNGIVRISLKLHPLCEWCVRSSIETRPSRDSFVAIRIDGRVVRGGVGMLCSRRPSVYPGRFGCKVGPTNRGAVQPICPLHGTEAH